MPLFDYDEMATTAAELIEEFGFSAQIKRPAPPTGPKHNQDDGGEVIDDVKVARVKQRQGEADGRRILVTDTKYLLSPAGVTGEPSTNAWIKLRPDGKWWPLSAVEPINPGDVDVYWRLYVR